MTTEKYSEQQLSFLTPEERSALEAESATDADAETLAAIAADGDDAEAAAVKAAEDAEKAATEKAAADAVAAAAQKEPAADEKADKAVEESAAIQVEKTFRAEAPKDAAEQRKTLRAEEATALKKLMDGELDADAYAEIKNRVSDQLEALVRQETTAEVSAKMAVQAKDNEWTKALNGAVADAKAEGMDYLSKELMPEFDSMLKIFSERAQREGMHDDNLEASKWALDETNKMMRKLHGKAAAAPAPTPTPTQSPAPTPTPAAKDETPAAARHNLKTLGALPNADRAPVADDVMAKMGTLQGEDLEKYMATLSSKDVERILAAA